jgi:alpha-tubulin suppressor-like RCC1 family protein
MAGQFISPAGDLERMFVDDYAMIDQFAKTGSLWGWGLGTSGQLGNNTTVDKSSPIQTVSGGTNWKQVDCGVGHVASIKTDGTLWLWGSNFYGYLGDNTADSKTSPVQTVAAGTNWKQVDCGGYHTACIKTDGTLWLWGNNSFGGQLGDNTIVDKSSPIQTVAAGTNWKQVAAGGAHTAAIKTDGTLWVWGNNDYGQLGNNTITPKSSPIQTVAGGTNWKQVSGGNVHAAAIKTDGTLWLWGDNTYATLGNNNTTNQSSPVQTVAGGTNWKQLACGTYVTACIKTDGTLWLWGAGDSGALGNNAVDRKSSPIQTVAAGTNWKQVTSSYNLYTAAIKTDGTLWTWGGNTFGQLGDNTVVGKSSPIQTVAGGTNWKQVSAGDSHTAAIYFYDAGNLYPSA